MSLYPREPAPCIVGRVFRRKLDPRGTPSRFELGLISELTTENWLYEVNIALATFLRLFQSRYFATHCRHSEVSDSAYALASSAPRDNTYESYWFAGATAGTQRVKNRAGDASIVVFGAAASHAKPPEPEPQIVYRLPPVEYVCTERTQGG